MSEFLTEYRAKYPEYQDIDDSQLSTALHSKYNADTGSNLSIEEFHSAIGYQSSQQAPLQGDFDIPEGTPSLALGDEIPQQKSMLDLISERLPDFPSLTEGTQAEFDTGTAVDVAQTPWGKFIGKDVPGIAQTFGARGIAGLEKGAAGIIQAFQESATQHIPKERAAEFADISLVDPTTIGEYPAELYSEAQLVLAQIEKDKPMQTRGGQVFSAAADSMFQQAPGLLVGILAKNPGLAVTLMGVNTYGQTFIESKERGMSSEDAFANASVQSLAEMGTEIIPFIKFAGMFRPGKKFSRKAVEMLMAEVPGESLATAIQNSSDVFFDEKDPTKRADQVKEYLTSENHWSQDQVDTLLQTVAQSLLMVGGAKVARTIAEKIPEQPGREVGKALEEDVAATELIGAEEAARAAMSPERAQLKATFAEKAKETPAFKALPEEDQAKVAAVIEETTIEPEPEPAAVEPEPAKKEEITLDPIPEQAPVEYVDPRLNREEYRESITGFINSNSETGALVGKKAGEADYAIPSGNETWVQDAANVAGGAEIGPKGNKKKYGKIENLRRLVDLATRGKKLTPKQTQAVEMVLNEYQRRRVEAGLDTALERLEVAREFSSLVRGKSVEGRETPDYPAELVDNAGQVFEESEYPEDFTGEERTILEIAAEARSIDQAKVDTLLSEATDNPTLARELLTIIQGAKDGDAKLTEGARPVEEKPEPKKEGEEPRVEKLDTGEDQYVLVEGDKLQPEFGKAKAVEGRAITSTGDLMDSMGGLEPGLFDEPAKRKYPVGELVDIKPGSLGKGIKENKGVAEYREQILKDKKVTPISIDEDGFIVDGAHRYTAMIDLGVETIPAWVGEQQGSSGRLKRMYPGIQVDVVIPEPKAEPFKHQADIEAEAESEIMVESGLPVEHPAHKALLENRRKKERTPDPVTGLIQVKHFQATFDRAWQEHKDSDRKFSYTEIDLRNLGGLNAKLGTSGADKHLRAIADILQEEVTKASPSAQIFRKGGDEFGIISPDLDSADIAKSLNEAQNRVEKYSVDNKLSEIPHTKEGREGGTGLVFATENFSEYADPESIRSDVDTQVEAKKKGIEDVNKRKVTEVGAVAPGEQAGRAEEDIEDDVKDSMGEAPSGKGVEEREDKSVTESVSYGDDALAAFTQYQKSIYEQTATVDEVKADAERIIENKEKIIAQLSQRKVTKPMLIKIVGTYRSDFKKDQLVKQAYESMLSAHIMAESTIVRFGGSQTYEEQVLEQIEKQTQKDVDSAYERQREYREDYMKRKKEFVKSVTDPETLPEFKEFVRVNGKDKLSAEQLAKYDELVSESLRPEDKPQVIEGEKLDIGTERAETVHSKTGEALFVVKLVGRVDKEKFNELRSKSKQFGGYYSSFAKAGAIPGFQFKTVESADQFEQLLSGKDVDKSDFNEAKAEIKQSKNAEKLLEMAEKLEAKANEEINRPRQANTARRASMAANASERAYKKLAIAKTVRNIAIKLQDGELKHLGQMSQVTQLETLLSIQNRAIPRNLFESDYDGYSMNYQLKPGTTIDDYIANAVLPELTIGKDRAEGFSRDLKGKKGYMRLAAELLRLPKAKNEYRFVSEEQLAKINAAVKAGHISQYSLGYLPDASQSLNRLKRLGITTDEQLRAAIRELDTLREEKQKEDPVKKLERDLIGKKIEGYFPTPKTLVDQMLDYADIQPGHRVLEPSAGKGNIAQEIKASAPNAQLDVVEFDSGLRAILEAKGYRVAGSNFMEFKGQYDRIVMNPPFENFQDIDHVKHAFDLLAPGGKLVAIMGAGVKNSRKKAVEFRQWVDDAGSYIEDLPAGSFKSADRPTGVSTVMVVLEKNDQNTIDYKLDSKVVEPGNKTFKAPGHNYVGLFRSTGIPARRDFVTIEGKRIAIPDKPQRIEPIMGKLVSIAGRRIYFGKIKGNSKAGFYRPNVGEIRTKKKNDVEVLAHELAHYLDIYSNVTIPNFKRLYNRADLSPEIMSLSYTDANQTIQKIEGFAEFVRLWLTNSEEAQRRAHKFYTAFNQALVRDRKLSAKMKSMQELMHKFYFQGPDKLGQALIGQNPSFTQRIDEWKYRRDSIIRQQTIDRFHAARKVEKELTGRVGTVSQSAWKQLRLANGGAEGIADYILNYGTVQFEANGDLKANGKSLHDILEPVKKIKLNAEHKGNQKIDLLMRYLAGRRALELHRQNRENLIPKETAIEWARLGSTYPILESIRKEYQAFNERMMDFYQEAGMIKPEGRAVMNRMNKDYVPFNRIREELSGGKGAGSGFQRLKGGTANLNDILVNIQDGVVANVRAALNNRAKQRLYEYISGHKDGAIFATRIAPDSKPVQVYAEEMGKKIEKVLEANGIMIEGDIDLTESGLLTFWQHGVKPALNESGNIVDSVTINGKPKYYEVQDPLLQDMLLSMNPESYSSFMNVMFGIKNFFTRTITLGVEFTGANLVRDTMGAAFLSKNNFVPFITSFQGMYSFLAKDKHYQAFLRSGGGFSGRIEGMTSEGKARRRVKVDEFGVMTGPEKLLTSIDHVMSAFEYGTRIGEFKIAKKNNKSDMDAGFEAREISTDFAVIGANRFLTGYIRTVPFLNAMIQSQDRVFREAVSKKKYNGNPIGFAMKALLGITIPTLALYLINKDDEDYQEIPDHEKRTNWHFKVGDGQFVKVPRPYDVGFAYATMPELFFKYLEDTKGKEFADGMLWTLTQMYGIDGIPAMMTGWWDVVRNKKWTGAPVVPKSLADVEATQQYTSNTSETFVRLGEALGVSPVKAEHMFKAYTGYLGGYAMWATDHMLWDEERFGPKPDRKASDNIFLRRFLTTDVRHSTAAMEKFFDLKEKSDQIVSTFKQTVDIRRAIKGEKEDMGRFKSDRFYGLSAKEKEVLFALNDSMNELVKVMYGKEGIKTAELAIKYNKELSGPEKRNGLDNLWLQRNAGFLTYYKQANQALQKAKTEIEKEN